MSFAIQVYLDVGGIRSLVFRKLVDFFSPPCFDLGGKYLQSWWFFQKLKVKNIEHSKEKTSKRTTSHPNEVKGGKRHIKVLEILKFLNKQ